MYSLLNKLYDYYDLVNETDDPEMIRARIKAQNPSANLKSYYETCRSFSWSELENHFESVKSGQTNIVSESVDRWQADEQTGQKPALVLAGAGDDDFITYVRLKEYSCQMANMLVAKGLCQGDRLLMLLSPCLEMYAMMLACARVGVIFSVIDESMGLDTLGHIFKDAGPSAILVDTDKASLYEQISDGRDLLAFVTGSVSTLVFKREILVELEVCQYENDFDNRLFAPETPLFMVYVSGSNSGPKGVIHSHKMMVGAFASAKYVLDIHQDSVLWSDADPSSLVGVVYGAFAPWLCGATTVSLCIPFSASACYLSLERRGVSVWLTSPLNLEKLRKEGDDLSAGYDFSKLCHIVSAGKNLAPDLFYWVRDKLKVGPHDCWVMTEAGMICIANYPSEQIKLGSMGKPFPGMQAAIIDENGEELPIITLGELAFKVEWPSMMLGIWGNAARTSSYFRGSWFVTGDLALKDEDGCYYHHGRLDDLLRIGFRYVGPYLIENVIQKHPSVEEVAVILKKSPNKDLSFKAYVTVRNGESQSSNLPERIIEFLKDSMSDDIPLHEVELVKSLPRSSSGRVLRRVLTAWDLGLPSGDYTKLSDCQIEI